MQALHEHLQLMITSGARNNVECAMFHQLEDGLKDTVLLFQTYGTLDYDDIDRKNQSPASRSNIVVPLGKTLELDNPTALEEWFQTAHDEFYAEININMDLVRFQYTVRINCFGIPLGDHEEYIRKFDEYVVLTKLGENL